VADDPIDTARDEGVPRLDESYGYRFLRLNRFNLGKDPVRTLDERLSRITHDALQVAKPHPFIDKVKEQTNGVANGDMRQCSVMRSMRAAASAVPLAAGPKMPRSS
jgi:hypothetical protein